MDSKKRSSGTIRKELTAQTTIYALLITLTITGVFLMMVIIL